MAYGDGDVIHELTEERDAARFTVECRQEELAVALTDLAALRADLTAALVVIRSHASAVEALESDITEWKEVSDEARTELARVTAERDEALGLLRELEGNMDADYDMNNPQIDIIPLDLEDRIRAALAQHTEVSSV